MHLENFSGGNPICPREIPAWQKEITCFFQVKKNVEGSSEGCEQPTGDDQRSVGDSVQSNGGLDQPARNVEQPDENKGCDEESLYQKLWVEDVMMRAGPPSETR